MSNQVKFDFAQNNLDKPVVKVVSMVFSNIEIGKPAAHYRSWQDAPSGHYPLKLLQNALGKPLFVALRKEGLAIKQEKKVWVRSISKYVDAYSLSFDGLIPMQDVMLIHSTIRKFQSGRNISDEVFVMRDILQSFLDSLPDLNESCY